MDYSNWMGDLLRDHPAFGDIKINNVIIPGSHDSGTFGTGMGALDTDARTQSLNISEQLQNGNRYFDLRVKVSGGEYFIHHGIWLSYNYLGTKNDTPDTADNKYILKQMRDFLKNHSKEILILKFQNFKNFGHDDYGNLVNMLKSYFTFPGCSLVTLPQGTAAYIGRESLNSLITAGKRVFVFFDVEDVPNEQSTWNLVFQYSPLLEKGKYGLWDPYWHDADSSLANDDKTNVENKWWPWHKQNLSTWNSDGFFVLQSHMQQLPGADPYSGYFNISEQVAKATYYIDANAPVCNNERNIQEYIKWAKQGTKLNIITFDYIQYGSIVPSIVGYYRDLYA